MVNNEVGSGTGTGPVQVERGELGGTGIIAGAVSVGTGSGSGAVLAPGSQTGARNPGTLMIQSLLTFNSDATYEEELNSSSVIADKVVAKGVIINSGAQFSFSDIGNSTLSVGTVFTIINNTSVTRSPAPSPICPTARPSPATAILTERTTKAAMAMISP